MSRSLAFLPFVFLTVVSWGNYGVLMHHGNQAMGGDAVRPFIGVGFAYFVIAVLVPLLILSVKGEKGTWSRDGIILSLVAGAVGALGALGVIVAFSAGLNRFTSCLWCLVALGHQHTGHHGNVDRFGSGSTCIHFGHLDGGTRRRWRTVLQAVTGTCFETRSRDGCWDVCRGAESGDSAGCGPEFAADYRSDRGRRGFVGIVWAGVAQGTDEDGRQPPASVFVRWNCLFCDGGGRAAVVAHGVAHQRPVGYAWRLMELGGGTAGALDALGIIYAFNFGGKPIFVMPLVFGLAPILNTITTLTENKSWGHIDLYFVAALLITICGAVTVLVTAPKPAAKPAPAPEPQPTAS